MPIRRRCHPSKAISFVYWTKLREKQQLLTFDVVDMHTEWTIHGMSVIQCLQYFCLIQFYTSSRIWFWQYKLLPYMFHYRINYSISGHSSSQLLCINACNVFDWWISDIFCVLISCSEDPQKIGLYYFVLLFFSSVQLI